MFLARKFYNDVVAGDPRRQAAARWPGCCACPAGPAAPEFFEMDDSLVAENAGTPLSL